MICCEIKVHYFPIKQEFIIKLQPKNKAMNDARYCNEFFPLIMLILIKILVLILFST